MWDATRTGQLEAAANTFDRLTVASLVAQLQEEIQSGEKPAVSDAAAILGTLRRKRYFPLMSQLAETMVAAGMTEPVIQRQYAQSLIEAGELFDALNVLTPLAEQSLDEKEQAEACGLIGRVHKQQFVSNAAAGSPARRRSLEASVRAYYQGYKRNPQRFTWHGINAVALIKRAQREGIAISIDGQPDADRLASEIVATLRSDASDIWTSATLTEASVALNTFEDALKYLKAYVDPQRKPPADEFEIAGTLRQLLEVWELAEDQPGGELVSVLQAALLDRQGGTVARSAGELQSSLAVINQRAPQFEKVFGAAGPEKFRAYKQSLQRGVSIARIEDSVNRSFGTGFVIRAGDFFSGLAPEQREECLLMTNSHVLSGAHPGAVRISDARAFFQEADKPRAVALREIVWESHELDATIARFDAPITDIPALPIAPRDEPVYSASHKRQLFIIGYPLGGELAISYQDNLQVGWRRPLLHYRTPTEPGSSGSPVFDDQWRVVALHHASGSTLERLDNIAGVYEANEGIWIHAIREQTNDLALHAAAPQSPAKVPAAPKGVFICYSRADSKYLLELKTQLAAYNEEIDVWDDSRIAAGEVWQREIEKQIDKAKVAVLLVSGDFLSSTFIQTKELPRILKLKESGGLKVLWVPTGPAAFERTALKDFQATHDPIRTLRAMTPARRLQMLLEVARQVHAALS